MEVETLLRKGHFLETVSALLFSHCSLRPQWRTTTTTAAATTAFPSSTISPARWPSTVFRCRQGRAAKDATAKATAVSTPPPIHWTVCSAHSSMEVLLLVVEEDRLLLIQDLQQLPFPPCLMAPLSLHLHQRVSGANLRTNRRRPYWRKNTQTILFKTAVFLFFCQLLTTKLTPAQTSPTAQLLLRTPPPPQTPLHLYFPKPSFQPTVATAEVCLHHPILPSPETVKWWKGTF